MSGSSSRSFDAESLLSSLMENVPGAIYRAADDEVWKVQRVSDDIERITGYPASDFVDAVQADDRDGHASRRPRARGPGDPRGDRSGPAVRPGVPDPPRRRRDPVGARARHQDDRPRRRRVARRDHLRHHRAPCGGGAAHGARDRGAPHRRARGVAGADRRRRGRRAAPDRARPARRRPAAPARRVAAAARRRAGAGAATATPPRCCGPRARSSTRGWRSCASWRGGSIPPCSRCAG